MKISINYLAGLLLGISLLAFSCQPGGKASFTPNALADSQGFPQKSHWAGVDSDPGG